MRPEDLVGVPYQAQGRTVRGLDCWGLVMVAREALGLAVPDYFADQTDRTVAHAQQAGGSLRAFLDPADWRPVPVEQASRGQVIAFRNPHGYVDHAGLVLDETWFLHALRGSGVVKSRWAAPPWCHVCAGIYDYVA